MTTNVVGLQFKVCRAYFILGLMTGIFVSSQETYNTAAVSIDVRVAVIIIFKYYILFTIQHYLKVQ